MNEFPIYNCSKIFNRFDGKLNKIDLKKIARELKVFYPCRLDAMAINPAAVADNDNNMKFSPGEVVISINIGIFITVKLLDVDGGRIEISKRTKRKVLVKHAYYLMCDALGMLPSLNIDVDDDMIIKHCGFGSSSSTIAGVCVAINEMFGKPISNKDLIKYCAANHGEEVTDSDDNNLKAVQCIGGGATNGLTKEGILIISGQATVIAKMKYKATVLIAVPNKFQVRNADEMMRLEEKNLYKFKRTGDKFKNTIAYKLVHNALPDMANGSIKGLADLVFDYRFYMGSNQNCSFVFPPLKKLNEDLKCLYEHQYCNFLALSSVGPAFFCLVTNKRDKDFCKQYFLNLDMNVQETTVRNNYYKVMEKTYE